MIFFKKQYYVIFKNLFLKDLLYNTWNCSMLCGSLAGRGSGGKWIHVCEWLSPFAVPLKLSQHC